MRWSFAADPQCSVGNEGLTLSDASAGPVAQTGGAAAALVSSFALAVTPLALFELARLVLDRTFGVRMQPGGGVFFLFAGLLLGGSRLSSRYPRFDLRAFALGMVCL